MTAHETPVRAVFDRADAERATPDLIEGLRCDRSTRVLVVRGDTAPFAEPGRLAYTAPDVAPDDAEWAFLGRDERGAVLAAVVGATDPAPFDAPAGWVSFRVAGGALDEGEAGVFVEALSLGRWLRDAPFCPACGSRTRLELGGWARRCPSCGRQHFPRTDPAVIVAVTSRVDPDRLLLGSNAAWEQNRYSCFAGFVEAGESLESAVVREVGEEAGVEVVDVLYRGSQPWPYPRSLMVGFTAAAASDRAARPDGDEILDVRWFHRDEIRAALAGDGDVLLPGPASIAHRLISGWQRGTL